MKQFTKRIVSSSKLYIKSIKYSLKNYLKFQLIKLSLILRNNNSYRKQVPIIVSLASYPGGGRHETVHLTIQSLLKQSIKPKKILLWLYEGEFANREKDLPKKLLKLQDNIFQIKWSDKDIKSYNKIMCTLEEYPNEIIVTVDDDIIYKKKCLEKLWNSYQEYPQDVHAHRVTKFYKNNNSWNKIIGGQAFYKDSSYLNLPTGCGGILYPRNSFYKDVRGENLYMSLAPTNDDQWLWVMAILKGRRIRAINGKILKLKYIPETQSVSLSNINNEGKKLFWIQFNNLIKAYPKFEKCLDEEYKNYSYLNSL